MASNNNQYGAAGGALNSAPQSNRNWLIYMIAGIAALGGLLFGYDTGVISGAILYINQDFHLASNQTEMVVSISLLGAIVGALVAGPMNDALGRKTTLAILGAIFCIGALYSGVAPDVWHLIISRIIVGFGFGAAASIVPVYISEVAPAHLRGKLVTFNQLAITIGIAVSYGVDLLFAHAGMGWRPMLAVAAIPSIMLLLGLFFIPESPRWLGLRNRWRDARAALQRLGGTEADVDQELSEIRQAARQERGTFWQSLQTLLRPGLRLALIVGVGLGVFQQFVGINTVIYYAPTIFQSAGLSSATAAIMATSLVGVVNVLATIVATFIIDKIGRRPLLLWGSAIMVAALIALGAIFALGSSHMGLLVLLALFVYIIAFAISWGGIFWLMSAEIFPTRVRAAGSSISSFANWAANYVVSATFLTLVGLLGQSGTFWLYAAMGVASLLFCWFLVPETKGKSLEDIERYWQQGVDRVEIPRGPVPQT